MNSRADARYHRLENDSMSALGLMPQALCSRLLRRLTANSISSLLICCCLLLATTASASIRHIWAVNDGEKVERDDLSNPNKQTNSAWDGQTIKTFGARNEIIAFQVIIEADQNGIDG